MISEKISGEWGSEPDESSSVKVLRTTNFTNSGVINFEKVVKRNISKLIVDKKRLQQGDVIIEKSGGSPSQPVGRVVYFDKAVEEPILCNNFTTILRPNEKVFPKYFFYALYVNHLTGKTLKFQNKTTGIINLKLERYLDEKIHLPPLPEQKRIADILDKADSLSQKRKESITLLDELLKSVFIDMFGDPVRNEKGWKRIELSKIVDNGDIKCGPFGSQLRIQEYIESGIPVYGIDNVQTNQFVDAKPKFITKEKYTQLKSFSVLPGDVLITRTGTVGRACIAPENVKFAVIGPNLMKVRVNINKLLPQFLSYSFNESTFIINQIRISSPGATVAVYNTKNLKKLILPVPPIELQASFANIMREIETLKNVNLQSLNEMNNQFNALLQRAFGGKE